MASNRSKQIEVKLNVDGNAVRVRFACKGYVATQTFNPTTNETSVNLHATQWLSEQFDDQLTKLQEAANGTTR